MDEGQPRSQGSLLPAWERGWDEGDGRKNITFKMNQRFFKLCRVYSNSLKMSNVGEFPWS